ncbi:MAG: hypothetical protein QM831_24155 [Kofleriaceae bacterium]
MIASFVACASSPIEQDPPEKPDAGTSDNKGICGDNKCDTGETATTCPQDCAKCGDNVCSSSESVTSCPQDCATCGDGVCSSNESVTSCPSDCAANLKLVNDSSQYWYYFYGWPCGQSNPYSNLLNSALAPNTYATSSGITPGCYNFQAWNYNSTTHWDWTNMQFSAGGTTTLTGY